MSSFIHAYVIMCNDAVMHVVVDSNQDLVEKTLIERRQADYERVRKFGGPHYESFQEYLVGRFWHWQPTGLTASRATVEQLLKESE